MGESYFFGHNRSNRTTDMGENVAPKLVFLAFIQPVWAFLRKKFQSHIRYSISHRKGYTHFCRPTRHSLKNSHVPKNCFSRLFWKMFFFFF